MNTHPIIIHAEFSGAVVDFRADGWFNATQAAARFGKEPTDWLRQRETVEYTLALSQAMGQTGFVEEWSAVQALPSTSAESQRKLLELVKKTGLVKTMRGGHAPGTWLHPKLGVVFARWLDVRFAVWCDLQIERLLTARNERQSPDWQQARREVAQEFRHVADMLLDVRRDAGKDTAAHHFINEARLIRYAMTGELAQPLKREVMSRTELRLLGQVERLDMRLIARGAPYADRKSACRAHVLAQRNALEVS